MHPCCWGPGHFIVVPILPESIQRNEIQEDMVLDKQLLTAMHLWYTPAVFMYLHGPCCAEEPVAGAEASH